MSERKVLNKYYPPDFDPRILARAPRTKRGPTHNVRLMAPFSMQCGSCSDYIYKGKKFNADKERCAPEADYLGIANYRFLIRCPSCSAEIAFVTDYQHGDYAVERGATRNFEPWRDSERDTAAERAVRAAEEEHDPMRALENRTADTKREMDIHDALDGLRTRNAVLERCRPDALLTALIGENEEARHRADGTLLDEEEEALVQSLFRRGVPASEVDLTNRRLHAVADARDETTSVAVSPSLPPVKKRRLDLGVVLVNKAEKSGKKNGPAETENPLTPTVVARALPSKPLVPYADSDEESQ